MAFFINGNNTDDTSNDEGEKYFAVSLRDKREVPRSVRNSKVRRQDKFRKNWSRH